MGRYMDKICLLSNAPVILVGNKCDLAVDGEREVNNQLGESCAEQYGIKFFTSALTGKRVELCLVRLIRNSKTVTHETATTHCC